jgi:enoyl-CoA hydratase/carnithine racemase
VHPPEALLPAAMKLAGEIAAGPTLAHALTKKMLHLEWNMGVNEAIDAEARAQAGLMKSNDFRRAFEAFSAKQRPVFEGD